MGMFDWIICEYPLPDYPAEAPRDGFQTKDLSNQCNRYKINSNGKLTLVKCPSSWNNYSEPIDINEEIYYTGELNFYDEYQKEWYEYDAVFEDGMLKSILTHEKWCHEIYIGIRGRAK